MTSFLSKALLLFATIGFSSAWRMPGQRRIECVPVATTMRIPKEPSTGGKTVAYFGQSGKAEDENLSKYCKDPNIDIIVLGFVHAYKSLAGLPGMNLAGYCTAKIPGTELLRCRNMGNEIIKCQAAGKKVLLSLGGQAGEHNALPDDGASIEFADNLWNLFGEGDGLWDKRPFGGAIIDGFDIDNENLDPRGYPKLISTLREHFRKGSKKYYISAAPQCNMPDVSDGEAVYLVDYLFIQHYNNPACQLEGFVKSFIGWSADIAAHTTAGTKVFAGFPGSTDAAAMGYATHDEMKGYVAAVRNLTNFGGIMTWDAVLAAGNVVGGKSFLEAMREAVT